DRGRLNSRLSIFAILAGWRLIIHEVSSGARGRRSPRRAGGWSRRG
ncbi:unnamed protein product, partial [Pylaiella littoralis]